MGAGKAINCRAPGATLCRANARKGTRVVLGRLAEGVTDGIEGVGNAVSGILFEPVIRLGVTGLSRSGKTVFITSLVANLLDRGRMPGLLAASEGRISAAYLQPQPDDTVPRFPYETHLAALTGPDPHWPEGTRSISELRLSFRVRPSGLLGGMSGVRTVHLDIVDYPGEWLLDLALLDKNYDQWSAEVLASIAARDGAADYLDLASKTDGAAKLDEPEAQALAAAYTDALTVMQTAGHMDGTPGRFLLPGDLAGSPVLTFAPLPQGQAGRGSLRREFARRFDAYKAKVVRPFFQEHFARIDRQIVLVDVLGALDAGPAGLAELEDAMAGLLTAFRPGRNPWLSRLLLGKRVDRILFAATKADHLHHSQHTALADLTKALLRGASDRAEYAGAEVRSMAIAALRSTTEDTVTHDGEALNVVRGRLVEGGGAAAFHGGTLPEDPSAVLGPARAGAAEWPDEGYQAAAFAPVPLKLKTGEGPPHIRLDRALEFLIGDRL